MAERKEPWHLPGWLSNSDSSLAQSFIKNIIALFGILLAVGRPPAAMVLSYLLLHGHYLDYHMYTAVKTVGLEDLAGNVLMDKSYHHFGTRQLSSQSFWSFDLSSSIIPILDSRYVSLLPSTASREEDSLRVKLPSCSVSFKINNSTGYLAHIFMQM